MRKSLLGTTVLAGAMLAASTAGLAVASPAAAATDNSPAKVCQQLAISDPEAYEFLATKPGGCQSSIASVGIEALMAGAFPSNAAAVGNCKGLEEMVGGYPYQFYGDVFTSVEVVTAMLIEEGTPPDVAAALAPVIVANYEANAEAFYAKNRAGCTRVLQGLHSGELFGLIFPA